MYECMLEARKQGKMIYRHNKSSAECANEGVDSGLYDTLQFPFCYQSEEDVGLRNAKGPMWALLR